jgi:hypothetical protein
MPFAILCPHCHHQGHTRDNPVGKKARCPRCKQSFVPAGAVDDRIIAAEVADLEAFARRELSAEPVRPTPVVAAVCWACSRDVPVHATFCPHCGEGLGRAQLRRTAEPVDVARAVEAAVDRAVSKVDQRFRCRACGSPRPPLLSKRVTSGGWVMFWILLLFCAVILCWIPLCA